MNKVFAFIFMFILSAIPSQSFAIDETIRLLQEIDFQNKVTIFLSDGTSCIAQIDPSEIGILQTWNEGDSIDITTHPFAEGLILKNKDSNILYSPLIELTQSSLEKLPKIVKKTKIRKEDSDRFTLYLTLSDGSIWKYDLWNFEQRAFNSWKVGDRLLLEVDFDEDATIINYDLAFSRNHFYALKLSFEQISDYQK